MSWIPATEEEVRGEVHEGWIAIDAALRSELGHYLVDLSPASLKRSGEEENVFIVARGAGCVVFFDDVEDEFGIAKEIDGRLSDISFCGELVFALQALHRLEGDDRSIG